MLKYLFAFVILMHGLIHFMGFAKAYGYGTMKQLTLPITKPVGSLWMLTALVFIAATILLLLIKESWIYVAFFAAVLSQILIFTVWKDAKWGTVANLIILFVAFFSFTTWRFEQKFKSDVADLIKLNASADTAIIKDSDLQALPAPVQQYLRFSGVVGKPFPTNMYVKFHGEMRSKTKDWFSFTSEQYNFFDDPTRLFFMKAKMFGITVPGYHRYAHQKAMMNIKLFGLFDAVKLQNEELAKGETVTMLNDMCLMAPASLLNKKLEWEAIDSFRAKVTFTNSTIKVSAVLYFNQNGELIDFISNDRYETHSGQWLPFSTPVSEYQTIHGMNLMAYGEAIWHYKDSTFVYGKFNTKEIQYNVSKLK